MTAPNLGSTRFGKVIFRVVAGIADGPDANVLPDALPVTGFGVLTPRIERIIDHGDGTSPAQLVLPRPVRVSMVNGNLTYRGDPWVWLIASEPGVWRWHAQFTYKVGTETLTDEFSFDLPDGDPEDPDYEPTNLATARVLTDPSTGVPTVVGPPGRSVVDVQLLPNGLLFVMSREGDIEVEIPSLGDLAQAAVDAAASATAAANSAQESSSAASAAASSAAGAAASATTAATMAADAADAATTATTKASEAAAAASTADTRATAASNSATAAAGSASTASTKAAEAADSAAAAAGSASTAATAASTATTKASDAASSASSAAGSASTASTKADEAAASAATADARATTASTAASTATTKADEASTAASTATTKAADAASAATTATTKAGDAAAAATAAEGASTAAAGSASAAATRAGEAASSATTAAGSATTATTKASEAAASAAAAAQSAIDAASVVTDGIPNASPTVKGGIKLAGDLGGTSDAPTVPDLANRAELSRGAIWNAFLHMSSESSRAVTIPYFMNDIAYNNLRGGATRLYADGVLSATSLDICFEPTSTARSLPITTTEYVVEIDTYKVFTYGTKVGVAMMESWRSRYLKIEARNAVTGQWFVCWETANNVQGDMLVPVPGNSNQGINGLRYTFRDFAGSSFRIGQLMLINYASEMGSGPFLPRGGGQIYGPISSPAPTAAAHLAHKDYVDTKVAEIVGSAPDTLDTLNELATALGNDPNFATTVSTQIGGKADKVHSHTIGEVTGLQTALDDKSGLSHTHTLDQVADLQTALDAAPRKALGDVVAVYETGDFTTLDFSVPGNYRVRTGTGYVTGGPSTSALWWNVFVVNSPTAGQAATTLFFATTTSTASIYGRVKYNTTWGGWVTLNAPYSAMSLAEGISGTGTSSRAMRPDYLKQIINHWITGDQNAVTSEIGKALALAADPAAAREVIEAAEASHTHTAVNISDSSPIGRSVLTAATEAEARTAIGAVTVELVSSLPATGVEGVLYVTEG
ncbi:hypothetical protein [Rhodococcus rhodochrous]|uniref:hypothetical protein n=1 Tax=Rhodococcus rhodochrous TaxID=1829 RepID=UPI001780EF7D|nr:hypothetical protein [Rhodococcus rhodochrous]QOH59874.1 hypothetical protein C6Y44_27680 [Rhodococcus rhodochrous]